MEYGCLEDCSGRPLQSARDIKPWFNDGWHSLKANDWVDICVTIWVFDRIIHFGSAISVYVLRKSVMLISDCRTDDLQTEWFILSSYLIQARSVRLIQLKRSGRILKASICRFLQTPRLPRQLKGQIQRDEGGTYITCTYDVIISLVGILFGETQRCQIQLYNKSAASSILTIGSSDSFHLVSNRKIRNHEIVMLFME